MADEKGNPFVTFSRLVDQQISSFFRTIMGVPPSFAWSSSDRVETMEQRRRYTEDLEISFNELFASHAKKMRGKEEKSFDDCSVPHPKKKPSYWGINILRRAEPFARVEESIAFWDQQRLYEEMRKEGRDTDEDHEEVEKVMEHIRSPLCELYPGQVQTGQDPRCPHRPVDENCDSGYRNSSVETILPSCYLVIPKTCSAQCVIESPYCPLDMETRDPFREHRTEWRKAFDGLLVSNGHSLSVDRFLDGPTDKLNWINLLTKHDLIGYNPLTMRMASTDQGSEWATRVPENDAREDVSTNELDLYECFLGSQFLRSATKQSLPSNTIDQANSDKPNLISTLTTMERRTLPVGGVYTQMILNKRFSDGREEFTETEYTTFGTQRPTPRKYMLKEAPQTSAPSLGHDGRTKQALGQKMEEQRQRGWLWS
ncbi:MAG: hypothetical protein Q9207_005033 [Kuettlingeria erythrocarpa]